MKNPTSLIVVTAAAAVSFLLAGSAFAIQPGEDGKTCTDPRKGPKDKITAPQKPQTPHQGQQAPKPEDSTEKWRDYINGNKKPPVRPKGGETNGSSSGQQAPKPGDSTKKWRDYINGNPKPPVRPK